MGKKPEQSRRPGRPATGQTPKRYFRMDNESYGTVQEAARLSAESTSDYIRRVLLADAANVVHKQSGSRGNRTPSAKADPSGNL